MLWCTVLYCGVVWCGRGSGGATADVESAKAVAGSRDPKVFHGKGWRGAYPDMHPQPCMSRNQKRFWRCGCSKYLV